MSFSLSIIPRRSFFNCLTVARSLGADLLSGGVSWMDMPVQCHGHLFWLDKFNGMQFTVIFRRFYDAILKAGDSSAGQTTDVFLSRITDNIFVTYPFIAIQKDFGYSDVTPANSETGYVEKLFKETSCELRKLDKVRRFFDNLPLSNKSICVY